MEKIWLGEIKFTFSKHAGVLFFDSAMEIFLLKEIKFTLMILAP